MSKIRLQPILRSRLANSQYLDFTSGLANYYAFLGKYRGWDDELNPDFFSATSTFETETRQNILALKKIEPKFVSLGVRRIDWNFGLVYDHYDDTNFDLFTNNFYVINSENNIYKCIWNNDGAISTVEPKGAQLAIIELSDGYRWKYMYTVSSTDLETFSLPNFIPVKNVSQGSSIIENIIVVNGGSGYLNGGSGNLNIIITGDGIDASATAVVVNGVITIVNINSGGSNYSFATATVDATQSPTGSGAILQVIVDKSTNTSIQNLVVSLAVDGSIEQAIIEAQGSNYSSNPTVVVDGDGEGAIASVVVENGRIVKVNMVAAGLGYRRASIIITDPTGNGASIRPILSPTGGHGSDIISELAATSVMFSTSFEFQNESSDFFVDNEFRQIGLIKDPTQFGTSDLAIDATLNACYVITLDTPINSSLDTVFFNGTTGVRLELVEVRDTNKAFFKSVGNTLPQIGDQIFTQSSQQPINITNIIEPEVDVFSGSILFIENRTAIVRSRDQVETLKTALVY